jgi:hypothetical protein
VCNAPNVFFYKIGRIDFLLMPLIAETEAAGTATFSRMTLGMMAFNKMTPARRVDTM